MDAFILQILNGLDKGSAYALIALGLTLIFGTLGVVNFAHGALFMIGAFCAVTLSKLLSISYEVVDETQTDFLGNPLKVDVPYINGLLGPDLGGSVIEWAVPLSIVFSIPIMIVIGFVMERGLIKHFYKRPHAFRSNTTVHWLKPPPSGCTSSQWGSPLMSQLVRNSIKELLGSPTMPRNV